MGQTMTGINENEGFDLPTAPSSPPIAHQVESAVDALAALIRNARPMPLSSSVMVSREEALDLVDEITEALPEELRAARWLLKEREEFLQKVQREADDILAAARARAERMVQRTEVVKAAEQRARLVLEEAEADARRMRHEMEDYCDQRLASFEIVLERTLNMVRAGRERLQTAPLPIDENAVEPEVEPTSEFFDQDLE